MAGFSQRAVRTIEDFATNIQMKGITAAPDGSYTFAFEQAGTLSLTASNDGKRAIVSLKRQPKSTMQADGLQNFMERAQHDPIIRLPVTAGMASDGGFVLAASIDDVDFDLQRLETCLDRLIEMHIAA